MSRIMNAMRSLLRGKSPGGTRSRVGIGANVHVRAWDPVGNLKHDEWHNNITCDEGLDVLCSHVHDANHANGQFDVIEMGTDNTAVGASDPGCGLPITDSGLVEALGTYAYVSTGECTITKSFSVTATKAVEETALLNAVGGTEDCFAHVLTGTVTVNDGDTLEVEWTITYTTA